MRKDTINFLILLISITAFTACGGIGSAQVNRATPNSQQESVEKNNQQHADSSDWVEFEPSVVELEGKLVIKTYFGPPNFGESPETDSKERSWILTLDKPINVRGKDDPDAGYDGAPVENVSELQLVLPAPQRELVGKKVIVNGTLFNAHTGNHHTDVLMQVRSIGLVLR